MGQVEVVEVVVLVVLKVVRWCGGCHPTPSTVEALTDQQTPRQIMRACYIWKIIVIYV